MSIVVENIEVKPEATSAPASGPQAGAPSATSSSKPNPAEVEKALRQMMERLARIHVS